MKPFKYLLAVAALMGALTLSAQAHLTFLGFTDFAGQPNNNPDSNLDALEASGVDTTGFTLCGNFENLSPPGTDKTIEVMAGSYLVVHYGGKGGGSLEFFRVDGGETQVTVPGSGTNPPDTLANPNSLSSIREFCPPGTNVPDSGTTAMLLGSALTGLGLVRRYLKQ